MVLMLWFDWLHGDDLIINSLPLWLPWPVWSLQACILNSNHGVCAAAAGACLRLALRLCSTWWRPAVAAVLQSGA
jgi:hypothetical protein